SLPSPDFIKNIISPRVSIGTEGPLNAASTRWFCIPCPQSFMPLNALSHNRNKKQVAARWVEADRVEPVSLGQPILRFLFLSGKGESILVMRLSYIYYNSISFYILTDDLVAIYKGRVVPDRLTFLDFSILLANSTSISSAPKHTAGQADVCLHLSWYTYWGGCENNHEERRRVEHSDA
ncbi:unnamed protein product, partial [Clonostachys rhizophaga]